MLLQWHNYRPRRTSRRRGPDVRRSPFYWKKVALGIPAAHVLSPAWRAPQLGSYAIDISIGFYDKSPALSIDANEYDVNSVNVY